MKIKFLQTKTFSIFLAVFLSLNATYTVADDHHQQQPTDQITVIGDEEFSLVSPAWLDQHRSIPGLVIIDGRKDVHDYLKGHVPGAVHLADASIRGPLDGLPVQFLGPDQMRLLFEAAGIQSGSSVVLYSEDSDVLAATMLAYGLKRSGHTGRIYLLDGGFSEYARQFLVTQEFPKVQPGQIAAELDRSIITTLEDLRSAMIRDDVLIIDARPEKAFLGETTTWIRNGHIPGAVSFDWHQVTMADNIHKWRNLDEIRALLKPFNIEKNTEIIVYCGTGREATLLFFTLRHLLNFNNVKLYEGSWTEYSSIMDMPIETGRSL
jgi:thiosulfate/3-mercaptopyruvate sulfurtransferase